MTVKTGQSIAGSFCTVGATGALTAATGTPVGTLYVAGVANGAAVAVTGANPYKWAVTLPALAAGDVVQMYVTATIAGVATGGVVWEDVADTSLASDVAATLGVAGAGLTALGDTRLANLDAAVWAYGTRTLTQSATAVAAALAGDTISILRGDTTSIAFTGLGNITGYSKIWFAVKSDSRNDADTAAIIYVTLAGGLIYLNGAAASTATDASMTVVDATTGAVTVTLKAALTAALQVQGGLSYDVQWLDGDGHIHTLTSGTAGVTADVARAVS